MRTERAARSRDHRHRQIGLILGDRSGFLSSPLGGGLAAAAAGGAIGYSSVSPIMGALGGESTGFSSTDHQELAA